MLDHIARSESFAVETTLRSQAAIEQARQARSAGFETRMIFICTGKAEECVLRVRIRGLGGGHSAPEAEIRDIYARSLSNLVVAADVFERIELHDNSAWMAAPRRVGRLVGHRLVTAVDPVPSWVPEPLR